MRSQTTQLNWKVFPECNGKTVSLGSQSAAGWLTGWPLFLVSLSLFAGLARSPGSLTASRSKAMTTAAIDCAFPSRLLSSFNAASFPSHRRSWGDFFKELSSLFFSSFPPTLSLSSLCVSIWRALCVGAAPPWRKEVGRERERKGQEGEAIDFPSAGEKRS